MSTKETIAVLREKVRTLTGLIKHYEGVAMVYHSRHAGLTQQIGKLELERDRLEEDFRHGPDKIAQAQQDLAETERRIRLAQTPINPSPAKRAVETKADKIRRVERLRADLAALQAELEGDQ